MKRTGIAVLAAALLCGGGFVPHSFASQPPPPGYDRDHGWDAPPEEFRDEIQRRGFHDGIEGARADFANHRRPNVNNRDEFRHPRDVPPRMRDRYREAFRRGYDVGVRRMTDHREEWDRH